MHILLVKMSSMGDIVHTLPAITDACTRIPGLTIDWAIEPAFADIARLHPAVNTIIPIPLRRWRKKLINSLKSSELKAVLSQIRNTKYDIIIDAQGLLKSALITKAAKHGQRHGLSSTSAREAVASIFYDKKHTINSDNYAVERTRELFAHCFGYDTPTCPPNFNISPDRLPELPFTPTKNYLVFLHGTTWDTKHYPEVYWEALLNKANKENLTVYLPWGNDTENKRAQKLAKAHPNATVLPKLSIAQLSTLLLHARAVIAVDTGLCHLSVALNTPTVVLFGPTDPSFVGIVSDYAYNLKADFSCAPCVKKHCQYEDNTKKLVFPACFSSLPPDIVWQQTVDLLHR